MKWGYDPIHFVLVFCFTDTGHMSNSKGVSIASYPGSTEVLTKSTEKGVNNGD